MDNFVKQAIFSLLRNLAAPVIVYLAAKGYLSTDEATSFVTAGITIIVAVVWGVVNKYFATKQA